MSAPMLHDLAIAAGALAAIAINSLWEGALLVGCVALLLRLWPGLNAATRYLVWSATLIATVIVPFATTLPFLVPTTPAAVTRANAGAANAQTAPASRRAVINGPARDVAAVSAPDRRAVVSRPVNQPSLRWPQRLRMNLPLPLALIILAAWTLLAIVSLARLAIGLFRLEQLKRDALPLPVEYRDDMARWTAVNKGSREVRLCVSDDIDVPVAVGLFDSMILIPRALLEKLSHAEVDQISLHELAHLRRADDWTNGLQRTIMALFAWNPCLQYVGQQLDLEREVACDDWVLALTGLVRPYAMCLTKMAETSSWPHRPMPAPGVFATRKHISLRIERLLGAGRNVATNLSLGPAAAAVAIVGALAFAMQSVAPSVAAPIEPAPVTAAAPASPAVPAGVAAPPAQSNSAVVARPKTVPSAHQAAQTKDVIRYVRVANQTAAAQPVPVAAPAASPQVRTSPHAIPTSVVVPPAHVHVPGQTIVIPPVNVDVPGMTIPVMTSQQIDKIRALARAYANVGANPMRSADDRSCLGCDLSGQDLSGRDLHGASYMGADLTGAKLQGTNFSNGSFNGVDFSHSNLHDASFRSARLTGCDFSKADLTGVDFTGATITGCDFDGGRLDGAGFAGASLIRCDFDGVDLSHVDLSRAKLFDTDVSSGSSPHA